MEKVKVWLLNLAKKLWVSSMVLHRKRDNE